MHILYIDDDPDDRALFQEAILSISSEIGIATANDGLQGFQVLENSIAEPDYIFVDVNMPVMGGKDFLATIKKIPGLRSIPVLMYSTTSRPEEINSYKTLGAYDFIIKPSSFQEVRQVLQSVLEGKKKGLLANTA